MVASESAQDALEAHIKKWGKMNYKGKMKTRVICAGGAETAGDALRRVYKEKCVSDDFLLATCENIPMGNNAASINRHFERKKGNKNCVMTKIMRPGSDKDSPLSSANFLLEKDNMEFLRYFNTWSKTEVPPSVLKGLLKRGQEFTLEMKMECVDLFDMCCAGVLNVLEDNFDVQTRSELVQNILTTKFDADLSSDSVHLSWADESFVSYSITNPYNRYQASKSIASTLAKHLKKPENSLKELTSVYAGASELVANLGKGAYAMKTSKIEDGADINASFVGDDCEVKHQK